MGIFNQNPRVPPRRFRRYGLSQGRIVYSNPRQVAQRHIARFPSQQLRAPGLQARPLRNPNLRPIMHPPQTRAMPTHYPQMVPQKRFSSIQSTQKPRPFGGWLDIGINPPQQNQRRKPGAINRLGGGLRTVGMLNYVLRK